MSVGHVGMLLAAGRGRRMGGTKQLRPGPRGEPLVAASFDALAAVCAEVVVVLGHEAEAVGKALGDRRRREVLVDPDGEMFDSVRAGLAVVAEVPEVRAAWILPADHAGIARETMRVLAAAFDANGSIVVPEYRGRGGHPVIVPCTIVPAILGCADAPDGLRGVLRLWSDQSVRCGVDDPGVVEDVDDPASYERAVRRWSAS